MILIIDNYDSFVENLARYFREAGAQTYIVRNDQISVDECLEMAPQGVVVSPGPKAPKHAGISLDLIRALPTALPFFGVCLGQQCLVEAFGGQTVRAINPMHGMASDIEHHGVSIFRKIPSPTPVGRYHSLISVLDDHSPLEVTARSAEGEVMAVTYPGRPWFGVQFHPESLLTSYGKLMVENFLTYCDGRDAR